MSEPRDGVAFDFNVKQYEEHRAALLDSVKEERQMEQYVVLASAAFYSWLAARDGDDTVFLWFTAFIPVLITALSLFRVHAIANGARTEAEYLRRLEVQIYSNAPREYDGPKGWETYLALEGRYLKRYNKSELIFWSFFLGLTVAASCALVAIKM